MEHSKLYDAIFQRKSIRKYQMKPLKTDIISEKDRHRPSHRRT